MVETRIINACDRPGDVSGLWLQQLLSAPQMDDDTLAALASRVGHYLQHQGLLLVTAESCTGGWIAKLITDTAGSSSWFDRGFVTYSNAAKHELLEVPESVLADHGAVSAQAVAAMVRGALAHSHAQVAVAVSGIAGPAGGSPEKPVGTVWLGWGRDNAAPRTQHYRFAGDRDGVRRQAIAAALSGLLELFGGDR